MPITINGNGSVTGVSVGGLPDGIVDEDMLAATAVSPLKRKGLWDNIHAKRKRIKEGSGEKMRPPGSKGAPSKQDFKDSQ